ncbi:hypothetical protein EGY05_08150 [Chryseobacterium arthrosphaerae]|uniref:hypothetical protein n=1 Tax=Chryseobacterium arthrosphaerae TaxID=651561 RepID=UPI000F4FBB22|nr:hypothetical protein [Chryseobacterium arthrosphaerae]AYZ11897.1 hypothetical protein EGY05_08150 [Chryseobacterium arthrosphaerae]
MKKFRINAQDHIINNFIECLENSIIGQGMCMKWSYQLVNESTLEFELKENEEFNLADLVWFGYFTAVE